MSNLHIKDLQTDKLVWPWYFDVTRNAEGQPVCQIVPCFWMCSPRQDVVRLQSNAANAANTAMLTGVIVTFVHGSAPLFISVLLNCNGANTTSPFVSRMRCTTLEMLRATPFNRRGSAFDAFKQASAFCWIFLLLDSLLTAFLAVFCAAYLFQHLRHTALSCLFECLAILQRVRQIGAPLWRSVGTLYGTVLGRVSCLCATSGIRCLDGINVSALLAGKLDGATGELILTSTRAELPTCVFEATRIHLKNLAAHFACSLYFRHCNDPYKTLLGGIIIP